MPSGWSSSLAWPGTETWTLAQQLKGLRAAVCVAACGSSVQAAEGLHLSQSSVIRAIHALERELGLALFERHARGMVVTPLGELLVRRADRAIGHLARAASLPPRSPERGGPVWLSDRLACGLGARHLQILLSLVETRSEKRSAEDLGLSAAAVQQTLAQTEHLAGGPAFVRARRGLRLTERGELLLRAARLSMAELALMREDLWAWQGDLRARIVIGALPFSTSLFLPQAVEAVLEQHPGLSITIVDGTWDQLLQQLRDARLDLIVGALRPGGTGEDLTQEALFTDRLSLIAGHGHPLARRRTLRWSDLARVQWVLPMPQTPAAAAFHDMLATAGLPAPPSQLQTNSASMMQAVLGLGRRLALMSPRQVQGDLVAGRLVELPLKVSHGERTIGVIARAGYLPSAGAEHLWRAIRDAVQPLRDGPGTS
jgi:LysR family transcriptional regulator, regulator for genes of the gallate degradation pathway